MLPNELKVAWNSVADLYNNHIKNLPQLKSDDGSIIYMPSVDIEEADSETDVD